MKMNLLWYLFYPIVAFLLIAFALAVVLASLKPIFYDFPWRKRTKLCLLQAKRRFFHAKLRWKQAKTFWKRTKLWWKKDWNAKLTDLDAFLEKKRKFLESHKNSFSCFGAIIGGFIPYPPVKPA